MIQIDDRAGSRDLIHHPPLDSIAELTRLTSADVCCVGNGPDGPVLVGVEFKSIYDLISSSSTGRLQATQIPSMLSEYDVVWLLYYGTYRCGPDGSLQLRRGKSWQSYALGSRPVPYGYVEGLLLTLSALNVCIKHVYDPVQAAEWVGCLSRWWSKPWSKHKGMRTIDRSPKGSSPTPSLLPGVSDDLSLRVRIAAQLPGVGFERALSAARYFPDVVSMVNASATEWSKIPGIGKVIGQSVERAVRESSLASTRERGR